MTRNERTLPIPDGVDFLRSLRDANAQCERQTDDYLDRERRNGSITTHEDLGTLVSLLDRAGSCFWGCHGGDHSPEHLVMRCCTYAISSFWLACSGAYDESVALARIVGEITNVATLFTLKPGTLTEWATADERTRREKYCPVNVRRSLEAEQFPAPVGRENYALLSVKGIHLTPGMPPGMYNADRQPKLYQFQDLGLLFCLAEISFPLSILGLCTIVEPNPLMNLDAAPRQRIADAAKKLRRSLPELWRRVNDVFPTYPDRVADPWPDLP